MHTESVVPHLDPPRLSKCLPDDTPLVAPREHRSDLVFHIQHDRAVFTTECRVPCFLFYKLQQTLVRA